MVNLPNLPNLPNMSAKSPLEASEKAAAWVQIAWAETQLANHIDKARMVNYVNGEFTFEVPTAHVAGLFNRRSEKLIIKRALEMYMPAGIEVSVQIVIAEAVQA